MSTQGDRTNLQLQVTSTEDTSWSRAFEPDVVGSHETNQDVNELRSKQRQPAPSSPRCRHAQGRSACASSARFSLQKSFLRAKSQRNPINRLKVRRYSCLPANMDAFKHRQSRCLVEQLCSMGSEHFLNVALPWLTFRPPQNSSPNDRRFRAKAPAVFRGAPCDTPKHMEPSEILTAIFTDLFQPHFSRIHVHGQCGGRL